MKRSGLYMGGLRMGVGKVIPLREMVGICLCLLVLMGVPNPSWAQQMKADSAKAVESGTASTPAGYTIDGYTVDSFRHYVKVDDLCGILSFRGSRGFDVVLPAWTEAFRKMYPGVEINIELKGSSTAVEAILKSEAQIGLMSRPIKSSETKTLTEGLGHKPSWIPVLVDVVAIIVNKKNPIPGLTLTQLDAIFSKSLKRGAPRSLGTWEELGVEGELGKQKIDLFTRLKKSTAYEFFVEEVLLNGEMSPDAQECASAAEMYKAVGQNTAAIGFCGLDGIGANVRVLPVGTRSGEFFTPRRDNMRGGIYPMIREFIMIFDRKPGQDLDRVTLEFLKYVLSWEGRAIGLEHLFFAVSPEEMRKSYELIE